MNILGVKDPKWSDSFQSRIDVELETEEFGIIPYTASSDSPTTYGQEIWENALARTYGKIAEYVEREPEPVVIVIPAVTLWERMTEAEAEQVAEVMKTQSVRTVQIFNNATTFRSDHELWPLLEQIANQLFGAERASELLAA